MTGSDAYTGRVAVKRLSAVEVDPGVSHQREFHANRLRRDLGFPSDDASGPLTAVVYGTGTEPAIEEATYTLYQARKAPRSEFRLYPTTRIFGEEAREGDLLLVYRPDASNHLRLVVARAGSPAERQLLDALFAGEVPRLETFHTVEPTEQPLVPAQRIADALAPPPLARPAFAVTDHPLYADALARRDYPPTKAMASAAAEIVGALGRAGDPDELLYALLEAETALFYAIEKELASAELRVLLDVSQDLTGVLEFSMSRFQSRKSRRGFSLQNHFEFVLKREKIPYTAECVPENPPPADIMVPSCESYRDPEYPSERLRMVSCKSTTKERWYETIPESQRIETKYLLTLDSDMSDNKIAAMWERRVVPFLPQQVIDNAYAGRTSASRLQNVTQLIAELRAVLA